MSDKRTLRQELRTLERVKTWQLVVLFLLALFVSATFLRLNNVGMIERRDAVYKADAAANDTALGDRLLDLQHYVAAHMNANPGDVYLDKKYQRDVEKLAREAEALNNASSERSAALLQQAFRTCQQRFPGWSIAYTQCVRAEQDKIPAGSIDVARAEFPNPALYRHSYVSPAWSPDFAGWSLVVTALLGLAIIMRSLLEVYLRWRLRREYRSS